jgi:enamine deaminase RidA (YjgF/YER057c/UK114 family)
MDNRIFSGSPFEELAGYSRAVIDGDWIFVSGTVGTLPGGEIPESIEDQMSQIFSILEATLGSAGSRLEDVVRCRVYVTAAESIAAVARLLGQRFGHIRPANTTLITGIPAPGAKVEIEVTARRNAGAHISRDGGRPAP